MVLRFVSFVVGLVALQFVAVHYEVGTMLYLPFMHLVEPFVLKHYGRNDGSLGPVIFWGVLVGALVYAIGLVSLGTLLANWIRSKFFSDS